MKRTEGMSKNTVVAAGELVTLRHSCAKGSLQRQSTGLLIPDCTHP